MFSNLKLIFHSLNAKERSLFIGAAVVLGIAFILRASLAIAENSEFIPVTGGVWNEGIVGQPVALNPIISSNQADQDISALIYSRLFELIDTYDVSKDGREYALKLKKDIKWDDGEPLTSNDILFTIKTVQDPDIRSPFFQNWQGVSTERLSELQVRLSLPTPYAYFLENIKRLPLIPAHIFGNIPAPNIALSAYNREPVGSGPYRVKGFTKRKDGFIKSYRLVPNKTYYGAQPLIQNFFFKFYESEEKLMFAFQLRQINGFGNLNETDLVMLAKSKAVKERIPMPRSYAIFFNQNINPALKEKDLRNALALAIDKVRIRKEVFDGGVSLANGPLLKREQTNALSNDMTKAREYLKKVKAQNIELNLIIPEVAFLKKTAELIKNDWLALGIAKVNTIELNTEDIVNDVFRARNYEMVLFGNVLGNAQDLFPFWHSSQRFYPGLNLSLYQNAKADILMETLRQTMDAQNTKEEQNKLEALITEDAPAIFLFHLPYTYAHTKNLNGFAFANPQFSELLVSPEDRFKNVNQWSLLRARVLK